jgi:hypothetical protein
MLSPNCTIIMAGINRDTAEEQSKYNKEEMKVF